MKKIKNMFKIFIEALIESKQRKAEMMLKNRRFFSEYL